jgi:hypothetical protein
MQRCPSSRSLALYVYYIYPAFLEEAWNSRPSHCSVSPSRYRLHTHQTLHDPTRPILPRPKPAQTAIMNQSSSRHVTPIFTTNRYSESDDLPVYHRHDKAPPPAYEHIAGSSSPSPSPTSSYSSSPVDYSPTQGASTTYGSQRTNLLTVSNSCLNVSGSATDWYIHLQRRGSVPAVSFVNANEVCNCAWSRRHSCRAHARTRSSSTGVLTTPTSPSSPSSPSSSAPPSRTRHRTLSHSNQGSTPLYSSTNGRRRSASRSPEESIIDEENQSFM